MKVFFSLLSVLIALLPSSLSARLYFNHIQKTGGTTLRFLIEQQVAIDEIYSSRNPYQEKKMVGHERIVSGHLPYAHYQQIDPNSASAYKITILRDPIERYLSFLRSKKKADARVKDLDSVFSLKDAPVFRYKLGLIDNAMCRFLTKDPTLEGEELLKSAKEALLDFDFVVFQDNFTKDVIELFKRFGISLNEEDVPVMNTTQKEPISLELLEKVRQVNLLDLELYQYAKQLNIKSNRTYLLRNKAYLDLTQKSTAIDYNFSLPIPGKGWTFRDQEFANDTPYPVYCWVTDEPAYLNFCVDEGSDYHIFFTAHPLTNRVTPFLRVNGYEVELKKMNDEKFSLYEGTILKEWIKEGKIELSFYSNQTFEYREIYPKFHNRNYPPLSFAVNHIQIEKD